MEIFELSNDVIDTINVGMYWTGIEQELSENADMDLIKAKAVELWTEYTKECFEEIEEQVGKIGIINPTFWSPKEYNYADDEILYEIEVSDKLLEQLKNPPDDFWNYIAEKNRSYSGYWCFAPDAKEKYYEMLKM